MGRTADKLPKEVKFRDLYERYYRSFCLYAKHFIEDRDICEDVISDVFTTLWDRLDDIDTDSPQIAGYLKMCVKNRCLNILKHQVHEETLIDNTLKRGPIYDEGSPDNVYSLEELYEMLYKTLEKLPESHRQVFIKTYMEGKKQEEIAADLSISVKSVNRYKQKTIELLRQELKDYLPIILLLISNDLFIS